MEQATNVLKDNTKKYSNKKNKSLTKNYVGWVYVAPAFILMVLFVLVPIVMSFIMSAYNFTALGAKWEFCGFGNYLLALKQGDFTNAFFRTLLFGVISVVSTLILGLLLAFLVADDRWLNFYRYIFYIPGVVSSVTMGRLWGMMLDSTKFGMLNSLLMNVFNMQEPIAWLGMEDYTWLIIQAIGLIGCGGGMTLVIYTTAINNVSPDIKEAAKIEGASSWCLATKITLPLIRPVVVSWLILSIIGSLKSFEFIMSLTSGGPNKSTQTLAILLFDGSYVSTFGYGYRAAMGVMMTIIVMGITALFMWLEKKINKNDDIGD